MGSAQFYESEARNMLDKVQQAAAEALGLVNSLATHCHQVNGQRQLWSDVRLICDRMQVMLAATFGDMFTAAGMQPLAADDVPPLAMGRAPIEERQYIAFLVVIASGGILASLLGGERYGQVIEALHGELDALDHTYHFAIEPAPFRVRRPGSAP